MTTVARQLAAAAMAIARPPLANGRRSAGPAYRCRLGLASLVLAGAHPFALRGQRQLPDKAPVVTSAANPHYQRSERNCQKRAHFPAGIAHPPARARAWCLPVSSNAVNSRALRISAHLGKTAAAVVVRNQRIAAALAQCPQQTEFRLGPAAQVDPMVLRDILKAADETAVPVLVFQCTALTGSRRGIRAAPDYDCASVVARRYGVDRAGPRADRLVPPGECANISGCWFGWPRSCSL
jgi:hypothetical protein